MKTVYKNIIHILAFVLIFSGLTAMNVHITYAVSPQSPSIIIDSVNGEAGNTVDVTITMSNNPGFVSANLYVNYDESILTLKEVKDGGLLSGVTHSDNYTSPYGLCWVNDLSKENFKVNGVLATLTFEISENAKQGESTISLEQDILNCDVENVVFDLVSGKVEISSSSQQEDSNLTETTANQSNSYSYSSSADDLDSDSHLNSSNDSNKAIKSNEGVNHSNAKNSGKSSNKSSSKGADTSDNTKKKTEDIYTSALTSDNTVESTKKTEVADSVTSDEGSLSPIVPILFVIILVMAIVAAAFAYYKLRKKK